MSAYYTPVPLMHVALVGEVGYQGWVVKTAPVLTGGYNRLKPPRSILPKVVNTSQYWSTEIFSGWLVLYLVYGPVEGLKNNCFVRNWLTVYYLASIVDLVGLGVQL